MDIGKGGLPDKPSDMIRLGLKDLELAEQDPEVYVDMRVWHSRVEDVEPEFLETICVQSAKCIMCLAGAVIRGSLGGDNNTTISPRDYPASIGNRLQWLDFARSGEVSLLALNGHTYVRDVLGSAVDQAKYQNLFREIKREVASYDEDPVRFKADMRKMADDFESAGL